MGEDRGKPFSKYVPVSSQGQVRFYLPLEKCADVGQLRARGYDVAGESRALIKIVALIREAESRRAESEQNKLEFVTQSIKDLTLEVGSIDVVCPYCLGRINRNWPSREGEVLCGWYDQVSNECDGNASYTFDGANLLLGIPDVERYTCPARGTQLGLAVYDFDYLKEEVERRSRAIGGLAMGGKASAHDMELAKVFPLRISLERTRRSFKEFVLGLMEKDAITWLNTLSVEELAGLLERSAASVVPPMPGQESDR